jgi:LEA14-like dessication related protein
MGKVIIETKGKGELKIRTSLTLEQIKKFIEEIEKKEKAKKLIDTTFNTLKENRELEAKSEFEWYEQ